MKMNDIISILAPEKANSFLNTFIQSILLGDSKPYDVDESVLMGDDNQKAMMVPPNWTPRPKPRIESLEDLDRTLYGSNECAECRKAQAKSGVMNIVDPCRGVCG